MTQGTRVRNFLLNIVYVYIFVCFVCIPSYLLAQPHYVTTNNKFTVIKAEIATHLTRVPVFNSNTPNYKTVTVNLVPSRLPQGVSATIKLITTPGTTGSAVFDNNQPTITITETSTVKIKGLVNSNIRDNIEISVNIGPKKYASAYFSVRTWVTGFTQTVGTNIGNGVIYFEYTCSSESGNNADLTGIKIGEVVDYPGNGPLFYYTSPPYQLCSTDDPYIEMEFVNTSLANIHLPDTQKIPCSQYYTILFKKGLITYPKNDFTAIQFYMLADTVLHEEDILMGPIFIKRSVYEQNGVWRYRIEKSGVWSEFFLP